MRMLLVILCALPLGLLADLGEGRRIYFEGRLADGKPVPAYLGGISSPRPVACVNCHRESGLGTTESGETIPPVSWRTLTREEASGFDYGRFRSLRRHRQPYDAGSFLRALTQGIDSSGRLLNHSMPRYALTPEQGASLIEFVKTLYAQDSPGVDKDQLKLALVVDTRLPQAQVDQHLAFFDGLLRMKNSESRREELRKRFAPVQKIPQYQSYRKWRFLVWRLSSDPRHWKDELGQLYEHEPVFAFLAPLIGADYFRVAEFCETHQVPCLFPPVARHASGSYYNFLLRDWRKRLDQYLSLQTGHKRPLYVAGRNGVLRKAESRPDITALDAPAALQQFEKDYRRICKRPVDILILPSVSMLPELDRIECPGSRQARLRVILPEDAGYDLFAKLLNRDGRTGHCLISDFDLPRRFKVRKARTEIVARRFGIEQPDLDLLSRDLFAFGVVSDSIHKLNGAFSRKYMLETIEHMLNSYPNFTQFAETSGAPYQREVVGALREYCGDSGA